jgi:hypothetical protein
LAGLAETVFGLTEEAAGFAITAAGLATRVGVALGCCFSSALAQPAWLPARRRPVSRP